jgi:tRNA threonylcarbamoyladenosine biosynthesis protein TsaE
MESLTQQLVSGILTNNAEETEALGIRFAQSLAPDTSIALHGNLGVGKTTFVKGLAKGFGIQQTITSPTFNLFAIYEGTFQLVHLDAYRLNRNDSVESLMLDDFLRSPYCLVIEWPDNIDTSLLQDAIHLELSILSENTQHKIQLRNSNEPPSI